MTPVELEGNPTLIPVVAAALIDAQGRVLMQQRRFGGAHGGLWEFPGGKVEPAESLESALLRELAEELEITIDRTALAPLAFAANADEPHVILLYTCRAWSGAVRCLAGETAAWFSPAELPALAMPPLDVPLARALREHLARSI